jgi:hypothetical protein
MDKIVCIDFTRFKNFTEFALFLEKNPYYNLIGFGKKNVFIHWENAFKVQEKIWVIGNYCIAIKNRSDDFIIQNDDLNRFITDESIDITDINQVDTKEVFDIMERINSIIDKSGEVGYDKLTEEEKEFLRENSKK